jgi:activator of HSP90 ATPase
VAIVSAVAGSLLRAQGVQSRTSIHQEVNFKASPARMYEALLDAKQFSEFTRDRAEIQRQPGGSFQLFGGRIVGRNIELVPNQRIVQAWRELRGRTAYTRW